MDPSQRSASENARRAGVHAASAMLWAATAIRLEQCGNTRQARESWCECGVQRHLSIIADIFASGATYDKTAR